MQPSHHFPDKLQSNLIAVSCVYSSYVITPGSSSADHLAIRGNRQYSDYIIGVHIVFMRY